MFSSSDEENEKIAARVLERWKERVEEGKSEEGKRELRDTIKTAKVCVCVCVCVCE